MANKERPENDRDPNLRLPASERPANKLTVAVAPSKAVVEERGGDPYNTSGSFDRKKHWERVGKR
ncbi:MAG: hypothetical protein ACLPX1_15180 [Steroidobacteraceae bacterium]